MRAALVISVATLLVAIVVVFGRSAACVALVESRSSTLTDIGICPAFLKERPEEVVDDLKAQLVDGSSRAEVEAAMVNLGLDYSWDSFARRYQAIRREPTSNFHAIVVYIYLDDKGALGNIEAHDSFKSL